MSDTPKEEHLISKPQILEKMVIDTISGLPTDASSHDIFWKKVIKKLNQWKALKNQSLPVDEGCQEDWMIGVSLVIFIVRHHDYYRQVYY